MSCGGIFFGTFVVLGSLISIYTGRAGGGSGGGWKPVLRDKHPVMFWVGVSLNIVVGVLIIIYASTHAPYSRR